MSLAYQCRLPLSTPVNYLADLLRGHLKSIRSRWRALPAGRIATIVLAVLRHDQRLADMAGGNDVSATTIRRWRDELITLLAAKAPRLDRALKKIARRDGEVVLIDGTLIHVGFRSSIAGYRKVKFGAVRLRPASGRGRAAGRSRRRDGSAPC